VETSRTENTITTAKAGADVRAMRFLSNKKAGALGSSGLLQRGLLASWDGHGLIQEL